MASLHAVEAAILAQVKPVTTGLMFNNLPIEVQSAIGWPPEKTLQDNVRGSTSVIAVYDRKMAKNTTRWNPIILSTSLTNATLSSALSNTTLAPGATCTLTLGSNVTPGDAVSLVINNSALGVKVNFDNTTIQNVYAQVVVAGANDTPSSLAQALANAISSDPVLSTWVNVSDSGGVLTITSLLAIGTLTLQSNVGNGGMNTREIGRRERVFQVVIWSPTSDIRTVVSSQVEVLLQQLETNFSLSFSDGSFGRLYNQNDFDLEDATLADTYRHDFIFSIDYPITEQDALFAVLAPVPAYQIQ